MSTIEHAAASGDPTEIGNELLAQAGFGHARIQSYAALAGGNPVMSQVFRVRITGSDDDINTAIVKMPARDPQDRKREAGNGSYVREVETYGFLRDMQGGFQPRIIASKCDSDARTAAMLIEDLGRLPDRDEFDVPIIEVAMVNLARIHSRFWRDDRFGSNWWIRDCHHADIFNDDTNLFVPNWEALASSSRLHPRDQPTVNQVAEFLSRNLPYILQKLDSRPPTLSHGDLHSANMMLRRVDNCAQPVLIDWQDAVYAGGTSDVAKFLSTTLSPNVAASNFETLAAVYHAALAPKVGYKYPFEKCWRDIILALLGTFANYVICASTEIDETIDPESVNRSLRRVASVIDVVRPLDEL